MSSPRHLPILAEKREEFLSAVRGLIDATNAEKGVLSYELFESVSTPNEFVMLEHYVDEAAFDAHRASPHFGAAGAALSGGSAGRRRSSSTRPARASRSRWARAAGLA